MAITWHEHPDSRSGSLQPKGGTRIFDFRCVGTRSDYEVYSTALSNLTTFDSFGYVLTDISLDPITSGPADNDCSWAVSATYSNPETEESKEATSEREKIDTVRYEFDVSTTSAHISHALHQTEFPGNLVDDAGSLKRAIESTYEGDVRGIDIPVPDLKLTVTKVWPRAFWRGAAGISNSKTLARTCSKTNSQAWWGFARGELQFLGARPEELGIFATKITYQFSASENRENIDFGEMSNGFNVVVPLKRGHEYLWVYHKRQDVPNPVGGGRVMVAKPWSVQVAQVFDEVDFGIFGLPNAPP
jgi:hypothetical protein